jgi:hypothetical protein
MRGREPSRKTSQREVGLCGSRLNPAAKLACRQDELLFRDPPPPPLPSLPAPSLPPWLQTEAFPPARSPPASPLTSLPEGFRLEVGWRASPLWHPAALQQKPNRAIAHTRSRDRLCPAGGARSCLRGTSSGRGDTHCGSAFPLLSGSGY